MHELPLVLFVNAIFAQGEKVHELSKPIKKQESIINTTRVCECESMVALNARCGANESATGDALGCACQKSKVNPEAEEC